MASQMTESDAREVKRTLEQNEATYDDGAIQPPGGISENEAGFPAKYFSKKEDEKRVRLLQSYHQYLGSKNAGLGLRTIYTPTEADYNVLFRKDAEKELLNFESFIQNYFDLTNPIHQRLLRELYPNYFERRLEVIRESLSAQEKVARLKLFGPQTKEDIFFLYALYNGDIHLPDHVAFDTSEADLRKTFKRGYLNYYRWSTIPESTSHRIGSSDWEGILNAKGEPIRGNLGQEYQNIQGFFGGSGTRHGSLNANYINQGRSLQHLWGIPPPVPPRPAILPNQ
jgi:hypothetical protein